jgi:hypothetical protein
MQTDVQGDPALKVLEFPPADRYHRQHDLGQYLTPAPVADFMA